ncbi:MAG: flavin reductase family protein [Thermodesulfobacteriota bacterium]
MHSLGPKPILFPTPVLLVGTYDKEGKPNLMTAAWGGICCSKPPCVTVSLRQATYTYGNLLHSKAYTLSIPSRDQVLIADCCGIHSGRDRDKYEDLCLTPVRSSLVNAPYPEGFPVVLECELIHTHDLGLHTMFVGEIKDVKVRPDCLTAEGKPDPAAIAPLAYMPEDRRYWELGGPVAAAFSIGLKR